MCPHKVSVMLSELHLHILYMLSGPPTPAAHITCSERAYGLILSGDRRDVL